MHIDKSDAIALEHYAASESCTIRTCYQDTIAAIEAVFDKDDVFYGIFEDLFTPETIAQLSAFLNVEARPDLAQQRVNTTVKHDKVHDELIAIVREIYKDTYAFCQQRFPQVNDVWRGLQTL
ncbi:hypothetical protein [Alteromonas halophila]|uniref:Uncharacterized protein n=1 Tax=Alteromonas halophila TaxID=516698 RepID=A0A918JKG0_9ALTE|nr:hypothetical protein [Alteromonas halophila]GGW86560.1 hypothetical protein GCM10007391_20330 [Alteromonas halophila]